MAAVVRLSFASTLVCLSLVVSAQISFAACSDCAKADRLCGPKSLQVACQKLGVDATLEDLTALSGYELKSGTSMAGLYSAAKAKGLEAAGMKIGLDELMALDVAVIAHLWNNHFAIVERGENGSLMVTDPPGEPRHVTMEDFQKIYSGFALLVAKDSSKFPTPAANGADLRVDSYSWEFDPVEEGANLQHAFTCRNGGNEDLVISQIDSSCGCTVAYATQQLIPPGGMAEILVNFDSNGRSGPQRQTVYIHSNDPITPTAQLRIEGTVRPSRLIYSPRAVNFGTVRRGDDASSEIFFPRSDARGIEIQKVSCDTPFICGGIAEKLDRSGYIVALNLSPDTPIGEVKGILTVHTNHPKDPKVEIPITARVKGNIDIFPDTLFFGMLKQGTGGRRVIRLSSADGERFEITKIDNPLPNLLIRTIPDAQGNACRVVATLARNAPPGYIKNEIVIHTNSPDQPQIRVPVYAMIEN